MWPPWVYQKLTETYVLDAEMRARLAKLNPKASAKIANRLIEAHDRKYWSPDAATLQSLLLAGEELEDKLEGIGLGGRGGMTIQTRPHAAPSGLRLAARRRRQRPGAYRRGD